MHDCSRATEEVDLGESELRREFRPDDLDVDDFAAAVRGLLDSADAADAVSISANSALRFFTNRASHVMGSGEDNPL